jgi:hypothetical protein
VLWHDPLAQVPVMPLPMQAEPLPTHVPPMQQPSPLHAFAAQQTCPDPPQGTVVPPGPSLVVVLPPQAPATLTTAASATAATRDNGPRPTSRNEDLFMSKLAFRPLVTGRIEPRQIFRATTALG